MPNIYCSKCYLLGFPSQIKFLFWLQLVSIHCPWPIPPSNGKTAIQSERNEHRLWYICYNFSLYSRLGSCYGSFKIEFYKWNMKLTNIGVSSFFLTSKLFSTTLRCAFTCPLLNIKWFYQIDNFSINFTIIFCIMVIDILP